MSFQSIAALAVAAFAVAAPLSASAEVRYTYTGNAFDTIIDEPQPSGSYDSSMRVTGFFTLNAPLAPNLSNFPIEIADAMPTSLNDGRNTFSVPDGPPPFADVADLFVSTNSQGEITEWDFDQYQFVPGIEGALAWRIRTQSLGGVQEDFGALAECLLPGAELCGFHTDDIGSISNSPGTWTVTSSTPVPASSRGGQLGLVVFLIATGFMALWVAQREGEAAG